MVDRRPSTAAIALALGALYLIWGSTYLAVRVALETLPALGAASARFVFAGGLLYALGRARGAPRPTPAEWAAGALSGLLLFVVGNGFIMIAEERVASGLAALLIATVPVWLEVLVAAGARRWPTPRNAGALALGLLGVGVLVGGGGAVDPLGAVLLLASALSWSLGSMVGRSGRLPRDGWLATALPMLTGGLLLAPLSLVRGESLDLGAVSARSAVAFLHLAISGSLVGFSAYSWLLRRTSPALASTYAFVNPVIAVVLGWAVAGEPLGPRTVVAAALITVAVIVLTTSKRPARVTERFEATRGVDRRA